MKQLPETVTIAGHNVELVVNSQVSAWGEFSCDEKKIRLSTRCLEEDEQLLPTIRHEMLHAAFSLSGISYLRKFEEEAVIRCLDEIFFPAWESFLETMKE
jgi:hypothetical protein